MNTYDVYRHSTFGTEAAKKGFSWPGFFFGWIWAFAKGLWPIGVVLLIVFIVLTGMQAGSNEGRSAANVMRVIVGLAVGFMGNSWRVSALSRRGFELCQTVSAESPAEAILMTERGAFSATTA